MNTDMKNILKASFDTELTPDQTLGLNNALKNSPELEAEKIKLNKIRLLMKNYSPVFSNEFLDQVMYKIREERRLKASRTLVIAFQRIAFPLLAAASVVLLFSILKSGDLSMESLIGISSLNSENLPHFLLFNY
jgi:anti-sigma factor RsiW